MPMRMSPVDSPTHSPAAPIPRLKHNSAPSGNPTNQYPAKWHSNGVRVSPEEAAMLFDRYNFRALPITDENDQLLGAVSSRDVRSLRPRLA